MFKNVWNGRWQFGLAYGTCFLDAISISDIFVPFNFVPQKMLGMRSSGSIHFPLCIVEGGGGAGGEITFLRKNTESQRDVPRNFSWSIS